MWTDAGALESKRGSGILTNINQKKQIPDGN